MNLSTQLRTIFAIDLSDRRIVTAPDMPRGWDVRLAGLVSNLLSPPMVAIAGLGLAARLIARPLDYLWAVYYLFLVVGIPITYLVWKVRCGEITDFHIRVREQRLRPMMLTLSLAIVACATLWIGQAPRVMLLIGAMGVIQVGLFLLVTLHWKISGHGAAIGSLVTFACGLYGPIAAPALLVIPLVVWARVRLKRHTIAQTVVGTLLGSGMMLLLLQLI